MWHIDPPLFDAITLLELVELKKKVILGQHRSKSENLLNEIKEEATAVLGMLIKHSVFQAPW